MKPGILILLAVIVCLVAIVAATALLRRSPRNREETNKWKKPDGEPVFMAISNQDTDMERAYAHAKRTLPQFLSAIQAPRFTSSTNAVKVKLKDEILSARLNEDRFAYLWLWNVREDGENLRVRAIELPQGGFNKLREGDEIVVDRDKVYDWMITQPPRIWGGFTMRVIRNRMDAKERAQYDSYTGLTDYQNDIP